MSIKQVQIYQNEVLKIEIPNSEFPTYEQFMKFKNNPTEIWTIDEKGIYHLSVPN
ncbi:MAG: hypothetical protein KC594_10790 [Nitrospira sp.]|nr:hypothetical protein [Nitrospira sp.]